MLINTNTNMLLALKFLPTIPLSIFTTPGLRVQNIDERLAKIYC